MFRVIKCAVRLAQYKKTFVYLSKGKCKKQHRYSVAIRHSPKIYKKKFIILLRTMKNKTNFLICPLILILSIFFVATSGCEKDKEDGPTPPPTTNGNGNGNEVFTCGQDVMFNYGGANVTYGTVVGADGRCWLDRNLGASQVATSSTDTAAYGDLFQWGRGADGHQLRTSGTTSTLSNSDTPGHGNFITTSSSLMDWRSPQNGNLWQGVSCVNNPCPPGWRIPTECEWNTERLSWASNNAAGAFDSSLKLPLAGGRSSSDGSLTGIDSSGNYWSCTTYSTETSRLTFNSSYAYTSSIRRAFGRSVRCIKDS